MDIAHRIQGLRKKEAISQEELAEKIGVSRQTISKWESGQSVPDIDKVILLSEYFSVTTDYLLKGINVKSDQKIRTAVSYTNISTTINLLGLLTSVMLWKQWQTPLATLIGLFLIVAGTVGFIIIMEGTQLGDKVSAQKLFWLINEWILLFVVMSLLYSILFGYNFAPYPMPFMPLIPFVMFWIIFIIIGVKIKQRIQCKYNSV